MEKMTVRVHKALSKCICSIMACLLLISGAWLTYLRSDSFFLCPESAEAKATITASNQISDEQTLCTNELLGYQRIEYVRSSNKTPAKQIHEPLSLLPCQPKDFAAASIQAVCADYPCDSVPSCMAIISYIHHQDGAKG